jgi:hypothetical protein
MPWESTYNKEDAETICCALAEGHSLRSICQAIGIGYATAVRWQQDNQEFAERSARAREIGLHVMAEECLEIADTPQTGFIRTTKPDGSIEERQEDMLQHRRLRIDTRMRLLGKWLPKVYGEKLAVGGADDLPPIKTMDDDALAARISALQAKVSRGDKG